MRTRIEASARAVAPVTSSDGPIAARAVAASRAPLVGWVEATEQPGTLAQRWDGRALSARSCWWVRLCSLLAGRTSPRRVL